MFSSILSASVNGLEIHPVRVETDISDGLPQFTMVGYLTAQVKEAGDRVRSAFRNSGFFLPSKRITVNLSPADVPKNGSRFDLPVAVSVLAASNILPPSSLTGVMAAGELSLNGDLNPVSGILPIAIKAKEEHLRCLLVPAENFNEASAVDGIAVIPLRNLLEAVEFLKNGVLPNIPERKQEDFTLNEYGIDFRDIHGQLTAKRAAAIAVAGFHNLLLIGSPGSGKTMIARRMPTIMPPLGTSECLEISKIYSISGLLSSDRPLIGTRPFRHPHHTVSPQALAGGGRFPTPGEVTLAHRGILFLDEFPEFSPSAIEILRQPLEDRSITISRQAGSVTFPAGFLLLAAMNPCKCGYYPDRNLCTCSPRDINAYISRLSRPLLDRIDLCVSCSPVSYKDLISGESSLPGSAEIREKVLAARQIQLQRFSSSPIRFNSEIPPSKLPLYCPLEPLAESVLKDAFEQHSFSARGYHRILKVARTIADLDGSDIICARHIDEALFFRTVDETYWKQ